jgi:hypothetical protein
MLPMGVMLVGKVEILVNGRKMDFKESDPIAKLLILEKPSDYEHSIAPNKVILEFEGYQNTYELAGCPRCMNEAAKRL